MSIGWHVRNAIISRTFFYFIVVFPHNQTKFIEMLLNLDQANPYTVYIYFYGIIKNRGNKRFGGINNSKEEKNIILFNLDNPHKSRKYTRMVEDENTE